VNAIDISYVSSRVEQDFTDYDRMKRKIGNYETRAAKKRMDQIKAAISFYEYLILKLGNPHRLRGNLSDRYAVSITDNIRLIIKPLCENLNPDTLKSCNEIEVKGVVKYHEGKEEWLIP